MTRAMRGVLAFALFLLPSPARAGGTGGRAVESRLDARRVGVIRGRVIDRETNQPVAAAQVSIVGTTLGSLADNNGVFTIRGVPAGTVTVRVSRIGYRFSTQSVTVVDGGEAVVDFSVDRAVVQLDQVVTTATGDQSRRELGHVVATVNADSILKTAPITNVTEVLQARTAGVQIIEGQGVIGGSPNIRIRGTSSLSLSNEPLIVVDGIRFSNEAEGAGGSNANISGVKINRFGSLDPEEIESVDIIKGPSAAALYGTAAANGVIIVKTKRGRSGAARWNTFIEGGMAQEPGGFPTNYRSWGRARNTVTGVISATPIQCTITNAALGSCVVDSLTSFNPWTADETHPFANGPMAKAGVQVTGGTDAVKYFISVDQDREQGPYQMPQYEIDRITAIRLAPPREEQINPNRLRQTSMRGSFTFPLGSTATLDFSTGYTDRDLFTPFDGTFFAGLSNQLFSAPGFKTSTNGTSREYVGDIFSVQQRTTLERFTTSGAFNWTPQSWLQLTAEGGVDNANAHNMEYQYPGEGLLNGGWGPNPDPADQNNSGIDEFRVNSLNYTGTLRAAATRQLTSSLGSVTTIGGQYFRTGRYELYGSGYGLGVGAVTLSAAKQRQATTLTSENATYGYFVQEQLNYLDKLYVTGSARTDLNSAFGRSAGSTIYPAAQLSYVMSQESWFPHPVGLSLFRLRASMGKAGLQPGTTAALPFLSPLTYPSADGTESPGLTIQSVGNPVLKPEVTTEYEGGFDAGFLDGRLNFEFTAFNKTSKDQLFQRTLAPSVGLGGSQWINIAQVRNAGQELTIDAQLLDGAAVSWGVRLNGSHLANKLIDVGPIPLATGQGARNVVGYPLFGLWDRPYTYDDANGDGVIVPSEITLAAADEYKGSTIPLYEAGLSNSLGFFNNRVNLNALIDYRGKFWNSYTIGVNRCATARNCEAVNVPGSSLDDQAAAVAAASASLLRTRWGIFAPNDFIKLREISVSASLPESFVNRYIRGNSAQIVLAGRNLATLWTKYPGIDPEANRSTNGNDDLGTPPALRTFSVRLNLGF